MANNFYTENLADFGFRERQEAGKLLLAELPMHFSGDGVRVAFNMNSGNVFLVNDDYQVAMLNGDGELEVFHTTPYEGHEGFIIDLLEEHSPEDLHYEDAIYIFSQAKAEGAVMPECWLEFSNALEEI